MNGETQWGCQGVQSTELVQGYPSLYKLSQELTNKKRLEVKGL